MGDTGGPAEHRRALDVLSLLSGKWDPIVVLTLRENGALGFNEVLDSIPDISGKVLSETLESLEESGIVTRRVVSETPLRVEYDLTPAGRELETVFESLSAWGARHLEPTRPTVLVAGGDRRLTGMYGQWLSEYYDVVRVHDVEEFGSLDVAGIDVALVADDLPGATSANVIDSVRSRCRTVLLVGDPRGIDLTAVPCDDVLRKPVVRSTVVDAVDEQLSRRGEPDEERERGALAAKRSVLDTVRPGKAGSVGHEDRGGNDRDR